MSERGKTVFSFYDSRTVRSRKAFERALAEAIEFYVVKHAPESGITWQELAEASWMLRMELFRMWMKTGTATRKLRS